jgi:uncharacterized protein YndB with AHSA1/START domain
MENVSRPSDRELFFSRTLNAAVDLVWEMFTTPEHLANWWGPDGFTNTIHKMDVRPGGAFDLTMHGPDGTDYENESRFTEVIPNEKIVIQHISWPHHTMTIGFKAQGEKTLLTWHMLFESAETLADVARSHGVIEGLKQNVPRFEKYLAAAKKA